MISSNFRAGVTLPQTLKKRGWRMDGSLMKCPNCGSTTFYAEDEAGQLFFFHVEPEGRLVPTRNSATDPKGFAGGIVFCISCSWRGALADLAFGKPEQGA